MQTYPQPHLRAQPGTMSNSYFQFKQMRIEQDQCAMKISTDACVQGAWTPVSSVCISVLDIGTGTGLLSLMLAQRNNHLKIDALEIDPLAAKQARENAAQSNFAAQISVHQIDAKLWNSESGYDLIICNPPFFTQSLKSENEQRNLARHNDSLAFEDLVKLIETNLKNEGSASILLPSTELERWETALSASELYTVHQLLIKPFGHSIANRVIILLKKTASKPITEELVIYQSPKVYTTVFTDLLRPFYLYL